MPWPVDFATEHFTAGALVLVRILALTLVAPILGPFELAYRWRIGLAVAVAILIAPLAAPQISAPVETIGQLLVLAGGEVLVGLMLGLGVRILFTSLQLAGGLVSQLSGLQMAEIFNPATGGNVPVFSQLLMLVGTAVFLLIGGHRQMIEALLDSFAGVPAGQAAFSQSAVAGVTSLVAQSFVLGLRAAVPAVVALLLATLVVGFVSRTLPQLNVLSLGFGINALVALVAFSLSLGGACWLLDDALRPMLDTAIDAVRPQ